VLGDRHCVLSVALTDATRQPRRSEFDGRDLATFAVGMIQRHRFCQGVNVVDAEDGSVFMINL
jgi:hypothetical protein